MADLPIMCTLPPGKMMERLTDFEALFAESLTGMEQAWWCRSPPRRATLAWWPQGLFGSRDRESRG